MTPSDNIRYFHVKFAPRQAQLYELDVDSDRLDDDGSITYDRVVDILADEFPFSRLDKCKVKYFYDEIKDYIVLQPKQKIQRQAAVDGVVVIYVDEISRLYD